MPPEYTVKDIARFWRKVDRTSNPDECWLWLGGRSSEGYGHIKVKGRVIKAHRMAWEITNGTTLGERCACHRCDTPLCCNPAHIFPGTRTENVADMDRKRRRGRAGNVLTPAIAAAIRARYEAGTTNQRQLAREFGIGYRSVHEVIHNRQWRHD